MWSSSLLNVMTEFVPVVEINEPTIIADEKDSERMVGSVL